MTPIEQDLWFDAQEERKEKGIQVPFHAHEYLNWLDKKGYSANTKNMYIFYLLELNECVETKLMPQFDLYEELPVIFAEKDIHKLSELIGKYEVIINTYISFLNKIMDMNTKLSAEYDDMKKRRSAWRSYSKFLISELKEKVDDKVIVNQCVIPFKDDFMEYAQTVLGKSETTSKSYVCRLRSLNDKYLSQIVSEEKLPFVTSEEGDSNESISIIEKLSDCISIIEDNIMKETEASLISRLRKYASAAKYYIEFLKHQNAQVAGSE